MEEEEPAQRVGKVVKLGPQAHSLELSPFGAKMRAISKHMRLITGP